MSEANASEAVRPNAEVSKRVAISLQQLYASLRLYYSVQGGGAIESGFAHLVDQAVDDRLITASSRTLVVDCLAAWCSDGSEDDDVSVEGAIDAAQQLGGLSRRIEELVPIGAMPGVVKPAVIDSWMPLARGLDSIASSGGQVVVRGDDGYCLLLVSADIGAWLASGGASSGFDQVTVGQVAGLSGQGWAAVDEGVGTGQVVGLIGDGGSETFSVLVFANEDYSGDPTGFVNSQVIAEWRRDDERRRRDAAALLEEEADGLRMGVGKSVARTMSPIEELALELGVNRPFVRGTRELDLAIITAVAGSRQGVTSTELWQTLRGRRSAALVRRGLADLPVFGSVPELDHPWLAVRLAYLVSGGVLRRLPRDGRYVLGEHAISAIISERPYEAVAALLDKRGGRDDVR